MGRTPFARLVSVDGVQMPDSQGSSRTLALVRMATGVFFLFFGEYKLIPGPNGLSNGVAQGYMKHFVQDGSAVAFYGEFLKSVVLPHDVLFTFVVGLGELLIGLSLVLGLWVRAASVGGVVHMVSLTLATWHSVGSHPALWRYFGSQLSHIPMLFLFVLFFAGNAGQTWGIDGLRRRRGRQTARRE